MDYDPSQLGEKDKQYGNSDETRASAIYKTIQGHLIPRSLCCIWKLVA